MSWDVHVIKLDDLIRSLDDLPADFEEPPMGTAAEVRAAISRSFPETDWTDAAWGIVDGGPFAIEFNLGTDAVVTSFGVHVHGSGDPVRPLLAMCVANAWRALDVQTTKLIDSSDPDRSSWARFGEWRDRVIKS
jgi:hypothetical protein